MNKELTLEALKSRVAILKGRPYSNTGIIAKLKRKIRKLEK